MSFFDWHLASPEKRFVGLEQYISAFQDPSFVNAFYRNVAFGVFVLYFELVLGFLAALVLDHSIKGEKWARILFLVPFFTTQVISGFNFRWMFNSQTGIINFILAAVGLPKFNWLSDSTLSFCVIVLVDIWQYTPFVTIILLAGLKGIPEELEQAASVDGASYRQYIMHVVVPLLMPSILLATMLRIIDIFRSFDVPYIMTGGGPGEATKLLPMYIYETAFYRYKFGLASAQSYIVLLFSLILCFILIKRGGIFSSEKES